MKKKRKKKKNVRKDYLIGDATIVENWDTESANVKKK